MRQKMVLWSFHVLFLHPKTRLFFLSYFGFVYACCLITHKNSYSQISKYLSADQTFTRTRRREFRASFPKQFNLCWMWLTSLGGGNPNFLRICNIKIVPTGRSFSLVNSKYFALEILGLDKAKFNPLYLLGKHFSIYNVHR